MNFKSYSASPPPTGAQILAFSPAYERGHPVRWRLVTQPNAPLLEVKSYITADELEMCVQVDTLMSDR